MPRARPANVPPPPPPPPVFRIAAHVREHAAHREQKRRHEEPRHNPGREEIEDRDVAKNGGIHDHHHARRDDRADDRGAGGDGCGVGSVVAFLLHRRDQKPPDGHRIGDRRAGEPGEEHAGGHVDVAQRAPNATQKCIVERHELLGESRLIHQLRGEDEVRNRDQHEARDTREHAIGHHAAQVQPADRNRPR